MENEKELTEQAWTNEVSLDAMLEVAKRMVGQSLVPFKTPEDFVMAWQYGKDIGLPFSQSMSELYAIPGKGGTRISAGVHVHEGICLGKSDLTFSVLEDAVDVYHYKVKGLGNVILSMDEVMKAIDEGKYQLLTAEDFDIEGNILSTVQKNARFQIIQVMPPLLGDACVDKRTSIRFMRPSKGMDEITTYHLHEAAAAGYLAKGNWVENIRAMLYARCFTKGSKRYASDVLKGLQETGESMLLSGNAINYGGDGKVVVEMPEEDYQEVS